ncbi:MULTISPECIES: LacI family DNA-binding transcriptional regulator [Pedobacter]|uniref:LacI family DNA-binding transcriptional regulator n=1 Tax=Pedobacter TaxID=84567 RepID=UPI001E41E072|nr:MULTISPECIES: LacI family DNA-binding transcriptional regulator [Pedobacter]
MKKKIQIKDIAKELNISITTVSFVINGKAKEKNISKAVTKKVLDLVEKWGYQPNTLAKSLRTGKTNVIGFLVDDISEPFFSQIAHFLDQKASESGYKILFSSTHNNYGKAIELLQIFRDRHVDGYIMALPEGLENEIKNLIQTDIPVVLFDRYVPDLETDYVIIDNVGATFNATEHLISNGYKNIAFVTLDTELQQMLDRESGYEQAMIAHNLSSKIKRIAYHQSDDSPIEQMKRFFNEEKQLEAVIFAANYICLDGLRTFKHMGIKSSPNVAVVSFDDFELLEFYNPAITAIAQPVQEIAENLMKILLSKLESSGSRTAFKQIVLSTNLNIRESTEGKN